MSNRPTLIALHGYSLNGALMQSAMTGLAEPLSAHVDIIYPDGPHVCAPESVDRLYELSPGPRLPPPHLSWWDATDDGRVYRGWENARDRIAELIEAHRPAALVGFSQGAILSGVLAALSQRLEFPELEFVIIISGSMPRAQALVPLFDRPITIPSLHVWGERDNLASSRAPGLVERFAESTRKAVTWSGPHVIPTRGPAAAAILEFVRAQTMAAAKVR